MMSGVFSQQIIELSMTDIIQELEHTITITKDEQELASSRANEIPAVTAGIVREVATSSKDIFTQLNNMISIYSYVGRTVATHSSTHMTDLTW
jgi:hypothetical protein